MDRCCRCPSLGDVDVLSASQAAHQGCSPLDPAPLEEALCAVCTDALEVHQHTLGEQGHQKHAALLTQAVGLHPLRGEIGVALVSLGGSFPLLTGLLGGLGLLSLAPGLTLTPRPRGCLAGLLGGDRVMLAGRGDGLLLPGMPEAEYRN